MKTINISHPNGDEENLSVQDALHALALHFGNEGRRIEVHEDNDLVCTMKANPEDTGPWRDAKTGRYAPAGE